MSTPEREALADTVIEKLGGKLPKEQVYAFVEVAANSIADGDKAPAWRAAETTAERIADSEWRPVPAASKDDNRTMDEVLSHIPRY